MFFDAKLLCSDEQDISTLTNGGATPTILSDKSIDFGAAGADTLGNTNRHDPGRGSTLKAIAQVTTAITSGGAATVKCEIVEADDEALTSNLVVLQASAAIAKADLVAGYQWKFDGIPPGVADRYVGFRWTGGGADLTAGKVTAGFLFDKQTTFVGA